MKQGKVYLVGAGPGDPKLITLKGLECLRKADVVVYDRLASPALLGATRQDAELIYVGKEASTHTLPQEEINALLIQKAEEGKSVTRLKGGDPYVFGRGGEEAEALAERGIPFEVIPGVSSAIGVPAYAGIPLTHRNCTSTVAIITGREDQDKERSWIDWSKISTGAGTLVFLMGMKNLGQIVARLVANGRFADTPVAVVRWGTCAEQQTVTGTLADIEAEVARANLGPPAVVVVGEVVALREKLRWFDTKPLFGKRILITCSGHEAGTLADLIEDAGGEALKFPVLRLAGSAGDHPEGITRSSIDGAIDRIGECRLIPQAEIYGPTLGRWLTRGEISALAFTSPSAVKYFFSALEGMGSTGEGMRDDHSREACRDRVRESLRKTVIACICPATFETARDYGLQVDILPPEPTAEGLIEALSEHFAGMRNDGQWSVSDVDPLESGEDLLRRSGS